CSASSSMRGVVLTSEPYAPTACEAWSSVSTIRMFGRRAIDVPLWAGPGRWSEGVGAGDGAVPVGGRFGVAPEGALVPGDQAERRTIPTGPLVVVQQAPVQVAAH